MYSQRIEELRPNFHGGRPFSSQSFDRQEEYAKDVKHAFDPFLEQEIGAPRNEVQRDHVNLR